MVHLSTEFSLYQLLKYFVPMLLSNVEISCMILITVSVSRRTPENLLEFCFSPGSLEFYKSRKLGIISCFDAMKIVQKCEL